MSTNESEILFLGRIYKTFHFKTIESVNKFLESNSNYGLLLENTFNNPLLFCEKIGFYCAKLKDSGELKNV